MTVTRGSTAFNAPAVTPRRPGDQSVAARFLPAMAIAATCLVLAGCSAAPAPIDDTSPGDLLTRTFREGERPAAPALSGTTLEGRVLHLSDYRGKVIVVNAWASWCGPCRKEAPELRKLQQEWGKRGVQVIGLDNDATRASGLAFQKDQSLGYPSLYDPDGHQGLRFPRGLVNTQSLPYTVVVDRSGRVAASRMGAVTESGLGQVITPLLSAG